MPNDFTKKYKRLSVAEVRKKYWNGRTKTGKKIKITVGQDMDTYGQIKDTEIIYFTPDGNLFEHGPRGDILHKDWLTKSRGGPYKKNDSNKSRSTFYYLTGKLVAGWDSNQLQICSGPLNKLSTDCLDEVGCWVRR